MFRSTLSKHVRFTSRVRCSCFHSTSRRQVDSNGDPLVGFVVSEAYAFHDLFQHIHNLTGLPWMVSIPVATFLMRGLITPARFFFAYQRREQRKMWPHLLLKSKFVNDQGKRRLATGVEGQEKNQEWRKEQWATHLERLRKAHPLAEPDILLSAEYRYDITNIATAGLVLVNTSTLMSLSTSGLFELQLDLVDQFSLFLTGLVYGMLALCNANHFSNNGIGGASPHIRDERYGMLLLSGVLTSAWFLPECPGAVILYALSNSSYTLIEWLVINRVFRLPLSCSDMNGRDARQ